MTITALDQRRPQQPGRATPIAAAGFSLVELLLALSLGFWLSGSILQLLLADSQLGLRVNRLLRERSLQQRTLALIRSDVQRAGRISANPQSEAHACNLGGRLPVLHLSTRAGPITYAVGAAPSGLWRGQVLMRCGPAFDLQGQPAVGAMAQNRVVIDGLAVRPERWRGCGPLIGGQGAAENAPMDLAGSSGHAFSACRDASGLRVGLRLIQTFPGPGGEGQGQMLSQEGLAAAAV